MTRIDVDAASRELVRSAESVVGELRSGRAELARGWADLAVDAAALLAIGLARMTTTAEDLERRANPYGPTHVAGPVGAVLRRLDDDTVGEWCRETAWDAENESDDTRRTALGLMLTVGHAELARRGLTPP